MARRNIGFISPPGWFDPTPDEFRAICGGQFGVQQTILDLPEFDWQLTSIANTEPQIIRAACQLATANCSVIANVGTPFGWAGLQDIQSVRQRNQRISEISGSTFITVASALFDALEAWNVGKVALACTYYSDVWREQWAGFVAASGVEVLAAQSMTDQGIMQPHGPNDTEHWAPGAAQIKRSIKILAEANPMAEAFIITSAGSRTYSIRDELQELTGTRVIAADTAIYRSILGTEL